MAPRPWHETRYVQRVQVTLRLAGSARWTFRATLAALAVLAPIALLHCSGESTSDAAASSDPDTDAGVDSGAAAPDPSSEGDDGSPPPATPTDDAAPPSVDAGAPAPDAAAFYGSARCGSSGALLCDSFEGNAVDTTKWTLESNAANTISIDTTHHARGAKSVRFHMQGTGTYQYAWLGDTKVFPQLKDHVFGRIFYMVQKLPTKNMHWTTIEASGGPLPGKTYGAKMRYGGEYDNFIANYTTTQGVESAVRSTTAFPIARWACFEWEYDRANSVVRFWMDEVPVSDVSVTNTSWIQPAYDKINLGWQNYQANLAAPMDVWMDEVALDSSRIGCVK